MENNSFEWLGWMLLTFFCPQSFNQKVPKEIKEIYDRHFDENGNIDNIEEFMNECKPYVDKFYSDLKSSFYRQTKP